MKTLLKKYFGYDEFRPLQAEIIDCVLAKRDTFVLMPTGGGKSLCFQLPALKLAGVTLVVSPLIALMKDQVDSLKACGVGAEFINSSLSSDQIGKIMSRIEAGEVRLLYIAPERFALSGFQEFLKKLEINLIAIDEAHCISEWGHDFRPDYRNLSLLKKIFPNVPLIALTATATAKVREDIIRQLNFQNAKTFISSFDRENLRISIIEKKQAFPKLVNILDRYRHESVIIYCHSRNETEDLVANLKLNGFSALAYHAGLEAGERKMAQELFIKDEINIIVATIAFGMGIDKPDVRLVVHYTYPKTLEGYYQEIGRAGRDGLQSECVMFYSYADTRKHEFFINQIQDDILQRRAEEKLASVLNFSELTTCRKKYLLRYFGEEMASDNCGACDVCLTERELIDATEISKKILSAVYRTGGAFGKNYIIEVLLGKKIQRVLRNGHERLSVFGIARESDENDLGQIINQLVGLGYLIKMEGKYPTLKITKKAAEFLNSGEKLELQKPQVDLEKKKTKANGELDYNTELFEILRSLRKEIADEEKVPPFVIFGDKALQEMAYYFPQDKESFGGIAGVGSVKLEKYSPSFLEEIKKFTTQNNIEARVISGKKEVERVIKVRTAKPKFYLQTKELVIKKIPLERIAKNQDLRPSTVIDHLEKMIDAGERMDLEYLKLPLDRYEKIKAAFLVCGDEKLKPVFEYLGGEFEYDVIRLVRVLMKS